MPVSPKTAPAGGPDRVTRGPGFVVLVINLDRSPERMERVSASAAREGILVKRVVGIEGATLDLGALDAVDAARFSRVNGRRMLAGEAGCYLSHIKAIETFLGSDAELALICEDDVDFTPQTTDFLDELAGMAGWDVVKLFSFRAHGFRAHYRGPMGFAIGRCMAGPVGSAAAYAVSREGAERLLAALRPMIVPYDVALERGWHGSIRFFMVQKPVIALQPPQPSTIVAGGGYKPSKYPYYRRLGALFFRAHEYARRVRFALADTQLRTRM